MTDRLSRLADVLLEQSFSARTHWASNESIIKKARLIRKKQLFSRLIYSAAAACVAAAIAFLVIPVSKLHEEITQNENEQQNTATPQHNILEIGTHVTVTVSENAQTRIPEDQPNALFVESGTVVCTVEPGGEGFKVLSEAGEAEVTGTVFTVTVENKLDTDPEITNVFMDVSVEKGTVLVRDESKQQQVRAGERTRIQARVRNRKRIRQQKGKRQQNGRQSGIQSLAEIQQPGPPADVPDPAPAENKPDSVQSEHEAAFTGRVDTYMQKQAEKTKTDIIEVCKAAVSALQEGKQETLFPELHKEISDYSQKNTVPREKVKDRIISHLQDMIAGYEAKLMQEKRSNPANGTAPRHTRSPRTRNRRSRK